jgi:death-on-curing protein
MWYLTVGDVVRINESTVGPGKLRDFGLLESAVLRPQTSVAGQDAYPDIHSKAAVLMDSLIRNHPFVDGNKRTALLSVTAFYGLNGLGLDGDQGDAVDLASSIAHGQVSWADIAEVLESWAYRLDLPTQ